MLLRENLLPMHHASKASAELMSCAQQMVQCLIQKENTFLEGIPGGYEAPVALALAQAWEERQLFVKGSNSVMPLIYVARNEGRCAALQEALNFWVPQACSVALFPGWDSGPYDYTSPSRMVMIQRMRTLAALNMPVDAAYPRLIITTPSALIQRIQNKKEKAFLMLKAGLLLSPKDVIFWLEENGFVRADAAYSLGEYAVRGGLIDIYSDHMSVRCDFLGDEIESVKAFDPQTQRSIKLVDSAVLTSVAEVPLTDDTVAHFQSAYRHIFGLPPRDVWWYEAIAHKRSIPGYEHWLPLFFHETTSLMDYCPGSPLIFENGTEQAFSEHFFHIEERYKIRQCPIPGLEDHEGKHAFSHPLPPDRLYLSPQEWERKSADSPCAYLSPFEKGERKRKDTFSLKGKIGRNFSAERRDSSPQVFNAVVDHIHHHLTLGQRVLVTACSAGACERLAHVLSGHGLASSQQVSGATLETVSKNQVGLGVWALDVGFEVEGLTVMSEQDIFGNHILRPARSVKRSKEALIEAQALALGDGVIHIEHGIGCFGGLVTVCAAQVPHDCLEIRYAGGDKLFLPVENIELLSRYGSEIGEGDLDKLGGLSWKTRRARLRQKIQGMAEALMKVAAARKLRTLDPVHTHGEDYELFTSRFPYDETEDQQEAVADVMEDLASGKVMDRLICGDAGFGKTEVALRAAFAIAMTGKQVAVVVPTTLLARQHYETFVNRFEGFPLHIAQASRFVPPSELRQVRQDLASGQLNIVVGTHTLLSDATRFHDLGLVIVDEEQHFGVAHKQRLKEMCTNVHVLTLSATPIPRTLQLALSGVSEISMIRTPPIDRLAVQTAISSFDPVLIRDWLMREHTRGGQSFYVCPRIEDLDVIGFFLERHVPEVHVGKAHGQMSISTLEETMSRFYKGEFSVLLSTAIVESGLDIPHANTMIVHRADRFGLAQLYQLRGRVGRGKSLGYSLFTFSEKSPLTPLAERRLNILQSLDTLGIGFQLASYDLDLRGAGNFLGTEQSGHIKEVGFELYQKMLEEAIAHLEEENKVSSFEELWSPNLSLGAAVTIPEDYIPDLSMRLGLYRRLSLIEDEVAIEDFREEILDRFGPLPKEAESLFSVLTLKVLCRKANIEKIEAGPKGFTLAFRNKDFSNPIGLMAYVQKHSDSVRVRPETMQLIFSTDLDVIDRRLKVIEKNVRAIVALVDSK